MVEWTKKMRDDREREREIHCRMFFSYRKERKEKEILPFAT